MNRFDTRNIKNKAIKYLLVLLIIFSYYFILKKTNFLEIIKEEIKHKQYSYLKLYLLKA